MDEKMEQEWKCGLPNAPEERRHTLVWIIFSVAVMTIPVFLSWLVEILVVRWIVLFCAYGVVITAYQVTLCTLKQNKEQTLISSEESGESHYSVSTDYVQPTTHVPGGPSSTGPSIPTVFPTFPGGPESTRFNIIK